MDEEPLVVFPCGSAVRGGTARVSGDERYVVSMRLFMNDGSEVVAFLDPMHAYDMGARLMRRAGVMQVERSA